MASPRPTPLERALALAFAGRLSAASRLLGAVERTGTDQARWLRAYVFAATGSFERAETIARSVMTRSSDPDMQARAAVTVGSVLRQTGRHAEAQLIEAAALRRTSLPELRAHLWIGLAADAVGMGRLAVVDRELARIPAGLTKEWRISVRLRWVRCEREMLAGRPSHAARWARSALAVSERAGARRHVAKSLLFLGAATAEVAERARGPRRATAAAEARRSLGRSRAIAARIGARPIGRVAGELLGRRSWRG